MFNTIFTINIPLGLKVIGYSCVEENWDSCFFNPNRKIAFKKKSKSNKHPYLGHFRRFNFLDLEEISDCEERNGHGAYTDHKYDQWWTVTYVGLQILQRV